MQLRIVEQFFLHKKVPVLMYHTLITLLRVPYLCHFGSTSFVLQIRPKYGTLNRVIRVTFEKIVCYDSLLQLAFCGEKIQYCIFPKGFLQNPYFKITENSWWLTTNSISMWHPNLAKNFAMIKKFSSKLSDKHKWWVVINKAKIHTIKSGVLTCLV